MPWPPPRRAAPRNPKQAEVNRAKAAAQAQALRLHIERCIETGRTSSSAIAADLNARASRHRMAANRFRCRFVASVIVSAYD
jgi:hypothetical protein